MKEGDTLKKIAAHFHTIPENIKEANNTESNHVKPGKVILVPKDKQQGLSTVPSSSAVPIAALNGKPNRPTSGPAQRGI